MVVATSELSPFKVFVCEWTLASSHNDTRCCFFFPQMVDIAHAALKETEKFVAEKQSHEHVQT